MSLGIVIKSPEGLVLAAESRLTITAGMPGQPPLHVSFDNATKLLSFGKPNEHIGAVTYGAAAIGLRTAQSFIPEFEAGLGSTDRMGVEDFAVKLSQFYAEQWTMSMPKDYFGPDMTFVVAGFDDNEPYGKVFFVFGAPQLRSC
jgi:hypothetical protein